MVQPDFRGKKVTVVGLARSGVAAARALDAFGAIVTVTDRKPLDQLGAQLAALGSGRIAIEAGGRVTGMDGSPFDPAAAHLVASNGRIHDAMLAVIRDVHDRRRNRTN